MDQTPARIGFRAWLAGFHPRRGPVLGHRGRWGLRIVGFAIAALGPVAFIQARALIILLCIAAVGAALLPEARDGLRRMLRAPATGLLGAFIAWLLLSILWTPAETWPWLLDALAPLLLGYALLWAGPGIDGYYRRVLLFLFGMTFLVLALALATEVATDGFLSGLARGRDYVSGHVISRGGVMAGLLLFPFLLAGERLGAPRMMLLAIAVVLIVAIFLLFSRTAKAALALAILVALVAWWRPRPAVALLAGGVGLYALLAPVISAHWLTMDALLDAGVDLPNSAWHRLGIWTFASERIAEKPIFGWGFNAARWFNHQGYTIALPDPDFPSINALPVHTHNGFLQVWLEMGLIGILLLLAILAALFAAVWRLAADRLFAAAALASMTATLVIFAASYSVWRAWWLSMLFFLVLLFRWQRGLGRQPAGESARLGKT